MCECGKAACAKLIQLTDSEYEHVRSNPCWYVVRPEHVATDVEHVIEWHAEYWIVETRSPSGRGDPLSCS